MREAEVGNAISLRQPLNTL